jgi:squalene-hopene/tetraprenyl-beta-curcumene cyclase
MTRTAALWLLPALLALPVCTQASPPPTTGQVRQAVERSLTFLEKEGLAWMRDRKCIACHHAPFLLWSHNEARRRGFAISPTKLADWTGQALGLYLADQKNHETKKNGCVEATNLLLSQTGPPDGDGRFKAALALLMNGQQADGSWKYEGQPQKRPDQEANEATTLWAALALASVEKMDPASSRSREFALDWLKKEPVGQGNEAAALRLVIEARFGDRVRAQELAKTLLRRQNPDGGWSWSKERPSDTFATGQSLYALGSAGVPVDEAALGRARQFLVSRQRPDGSWYSPTKKPAGRDNPIANYWGTAWATIGLVRTLPEP